MSAQDLIRLLDRLTDAATPALASSLYEEGEEIMTKAKDRTPVDEGTLRASGWVEKPKISGDKEVTVMLAFGGEAEAYALIQHEDLSLHHDVGEAKFLEKSVDEARSGMQGRLAASMRRKLDRL